MPRLTMKAMLLERVVSLEETAEPLRLAEVPLPRPGPREVLVRVSACGVCHTELDEIEGRTAPPRLPVIPGHEVIGTIVSVGPLVTRLSAGQRVGVGWIYTSSGGKDENLSAAFRATGRDANGGYAEYMAVGEDYACLVPEVFEDARAAPLLCAGAVGYRALRLAGITDGDALGLTGFGGSAHLVLQTARYRYPNTPIAVFARNPASRAFALEMGARWGGDTTDRCPFPLKAIIDTTPAWKPVVEALANLAPGGRLVVNAIRKEDADKGYLANLDYAAHLWMEREIKSVANVTARDIDEFLELAAEARIRPEIETYRLADANRALLELKRGPVRGAKVLVMDAPD